MAAERIVLLLGAGASNAFGFPLTGGILPIILRNLKQGELFGDSQAARKHRKKLETFLTLIMPGIMKKEETPISITELLSLVDHMIVTSTVPFPKSDTADLISLRMLLERAILEALKWPYDPKCLSDVPENLIRLADWILKVGQKSHCAIVSTNYDECVETEIYRHIGDHKLVNELVDFGVGWRESPTDEIWHPRPEAPCGIYKLHGSVNWLKCELCNWLTCNDDYIFSETTYSAISYLQRSPLTTCACGHWPLRSVMVAPSTVRDIRDINLLAVWKAAFEALRAADRWYIIGYSMPSEDVAIRSMLIRAFNGRKLHPKIEVVQVEGDSITRDRYLSYFPNCDYQTDGMSGFINRLSDAT